MDVKAAHLNGRLEDIYMKLPSGLKVENSNQKVCKLNKSLYGLKQSGRVWYETFVNEIKEEGFKSIYDEGCLFYSDKKNAIISIY